MSAVRTAFHKNMGNWGQLRWAVWNQRMVAFGSGQDAALRIASQKAVPFVPSVERTLGLSKTARELAQRFVTHGRATLAH